MKPFPSRRRRAWGTEMETQFTRGALRDPRVGEMSFREWHDRWWNARIVEPYTLRGDASSIKNHVLPYWADWEMRAITRMDIQSWIRTLAENSTGAAAIQRAYNLMSSIMRAAVDDDAIAVSPCRRIDLPQIAVKPPQWFTLDQAQSILDELPAPWKMMCLLGFYTGLRWGELSGCTATASTSAAHACSWWRPIPKAASRSTPRAPGADGKSRCRPMSWRSSPASSTASTGTRWCSPPSPRAVPDAASTTATGGPVPK